MAAPDHGFTDEIGEEEDWIELYNYGDKSLDIAGVAFSDGTSITVIPTGFSDKTTVKHSDYIVLFFDKDTEQGPLHIDAKLSSGGEKIVVIFDQYTSLEHTYGAQEAHVSMGRSPDGTGPFVTMDPSPGGANAVQSSTISSTAADCSDGDRRGDTQRAECRTSADTCDAAEIISIQACVVSCTSHSCVAALAALRQVCENPTAPARCELPAAINAEITTEHTDISHLHDGLKDSFSAITLELKESADYGAAGVVSYFKSTENTFFNFEGTRMVVEDGSSGRQLLNVSVAETSMRGKGTLNHNLCPRRGISIALEDKVQINGESLKKFALIAMCEDVNYATMLSSMHIARRIGLWKGTFSFVEVRLGTSGQKAITQGLYMLVSRPEDAVEGRDGNTMVIRMRSNPDGSEAEPKTPVIEATWESFKSLFWCSSDTAAELSKRLNMDNYMDWLAFNAVLHNGDYIDEAYFYDTAAQHGVNTNTTSYWSVHPWDLDAVFTSCHVPDAEEVAGGTYPLFYCAESQIDACIYENPDLRSQYEAKVGEMLNIITPAAYKTLVHSVADTVQTWFSSFEFGHVMERSASFARPE
jgi:hypothetical protein